MTTAHNTPGIPPLTNEERTYVDAALDAMQSLKKTFEFWMAIAQGLKALRDKADVIGGRFTFDRLREREGLGPAQINKTRVSRLLAILAHREDVEAWRATLASNQRFEWASPEAVWNHCPIFHDNSPRESKPSRMAELERINADLQEENHRLKERLRTADGSLFDLRKDSAPHIVETIAAHTPDSKVLQIGRGLIAKYKAKLKPAG